ncbi:hypothetical protein C8R44DRAFT_991824 [Mycena epipterygia]|nr:hypothetical protein C8R44DRAFT_991824 [Mycena epipterygia]
MLLCFSSLIMAFVHIVLPEEGGVVMELSQEFYGWADGISGNTRSKCYVDGALPEAGDDVPGVLGATRRISWES